MNVLFCNPKNAQGTTHSRKGMYVPLGILSIATVLKQELGDRVHIQVIDEDVQEIDLNVLADFDLVGFYATTFNYRTCIEYATVAKEHGAKTFIGGPHVTVLAKNVISNQVCFDYAVRFEGEMPILRLVKCLLTGDQDSIADIPNLVFMQEGKIVANPNIYENDLKSLPIPSREFIPFESYIENFKKMYPDKAHIRPGSIYSSKGCSWRDKTGGCVFCARLEKGVKCRDIGQIWEEIQILRERYRVNSIWDISDDNLNNRPWFKEFVDRRPQDCEDLTFFIYSRVTYINEEIVAYMKKLNVREVFLGVESGDDALLKGSFKGQTTKSVMRAVTLLKDNGITYFPSFVLGLPGETHASMENTLKLCEQLSELGGLERMGCTILWPIPGSPVYNKMLQHPEIGPSLTAKDDVDLKELEQLWIENFTSIDYRTAVEYRNKINNVMKGCFVFGGRDDD